MPPPRGRSGTAEQAGAAYARFSVWKMREICSMTGPVSGSFIHCVLFSGFSSMSSKAVETAGRAGAPMSSQHDGVNPRAQEDWTSGQGGLSLNPQAKPTPQTTELF